MNFLNKSVIENLENFNQKFLSKKPFKYVVIENFIEEPIAKKIYDSYPEIDVNSSNWNGTTYINQKNKFCKTQFEENSILYELFKELNSEAFLKILSKITFIPNLIADNELFGGGLHQSINGAFLNVHIDYNIHPKTKYHRRCNLIIFMNKEWNDDYNGHLEFWDFTNHKNGELLEKISPTFNRAVIFETNEISYHGHPHPLNTPKNLTRKSIATYYYTKEREDIDVVSEHNTIYKNTTGLKGQKKRLNSGLKAFFERIKK